MQAAFEKPQGKHGRPFHRRPVMRSKLFLEHVRVGTELVGWQENRKVIVTAIGKVKFLFQFADGGTIVEGIEQVSLIENKQARWRIVGQENIGDE